MFVEEKAKGEAVQVPVMKLSQAIREGCKTVPECETYSGCALGTAYRYITGQDLGRARCGTVTAIIGLFDVPYAEASFVSVSHYRYMGSMPNGMSREQCADYLESKGY